MVRIELGLPKDSSFLNSILWEGLLYALCFSSAKYENSCLELSADFLARSIEKLEKDRIDALTIPTTGKNDRTGIQNLLKVCDIKDQARNYRELLSKIKLAPSGCTSKDKIQLAITLKTREMVIDEPRVAAPQLFKIDRYTGLSSIESGYTSKQLTIRTSKEVLLLLLLGLYSSFVVTTRQQKQQYYFFLVFSPDESEKMISRLNDEEYRKRLFRTKEAIRENLRRALGKTTISEAVLLQLFLTVEIERLLEKENLEKLSTILFKISPEGQTYKIYEQIPIGVSRYHFSDIVRKYFRENFLEDLSNFLRPDGMIFETLGNLDYPEANNVVRGIFGLYRFIVSGNSEGIYECAREFYNAHKKLEGSSNPREKKRSKIYQQIVKAFY